MVKHTAPTLQEYLDTRLPPAHYDVENYVHFAPVSERLQRHEIIEELRDDFSRRAGKSSDAKRLHIGAAGFFNFDIVHASRADACVLIDKNSNQRLFWDGIVRMIHDAPNKDAFRELFSQHAAEYLPKELTNSTGVWVGDLDYANFMGDTQWARKDDSYRYIRNLVEHGKVASVTLDVFDVPRCETLAGALKKYRDGQDAGYRTKTVYGSNIWDFVNAHVDVRAIQDYMEFVVKELRAHEGSDEATLIAKATEASAGFFAQTKFAEAAATAERMELMGKHAYSVLKQSGALMPDLLEDEIDERTAHAEEMFLKHMMRQFTDMDFKDLKLEKPSVGGDFHGTDVHATLHGLHALAPRKDATLYLCDTHNERAVMKLTGGKLKPRTEETQGLVGGIQ